MNNQPDPNDAAQSPVDNTPPVDNDSLADATLPADNSLPVDGVAPADDAAPADNPPPADKTPAKSKKKNKVRYPFWKRLLIFLLGSIIGFTSCIGAIAGVGFWAYKNLSVQKLNDFGLAITLPEALQGEGEVDITAYTIEALISDITYYTGSGSKDLTIRALREKYGLNLLSDVEELIPESQEGSHSNIATIGVAFGFALMMMLDVALG